MQKTRRSNANSIGIKPVSQKIDFFDSKYSTQYQLVIDESNISDHPFMSYLNCQEEGYFTVHFIPKNRKIQLFWAEDYYKKANFNTYDFEKDPPKIKQILNSTLSDYHIFAYHIKKEELETSANCSVESTWFKEDAKADIYVYDPNIKEWTLLSNQILADKLPPYHDYEFFATLFPEIIKSCDELIINLVKSSNARAFKKYAGAQIRVSDRTTGKITVEIFVTSDISEDPSIQKMTDHSVGWLAFYPNSGKLFDITNDPENPIQANYNKNVFRNYDFKNICN